MKSYAFQFKFQTINYSKSLLKIRFQLFNFKFQFRLICVTNNLHFRWFVLTNLWTILFNDFFKNFNSILELKVLCLKAEKMDIILFGQANAQENLLQKRLFLSIMCIKYIFFLFSAFFQFLFVLKICFG